MSQRFKGKLADITVLDAFRRFILCKRGEGLSEKTLITYQAHFDSVSKFLDEGTPIDLLTASDVRAAFGEMAQTDLSRNSIRSYSATMKSFFAWCETEGLCEVHISLFKGEESVKETYTDAELKRLLKHPNRKSMTFAELRTWTIINLLVNNGIRAASVRSIKVSDVDLSVPAITLRHTKVKKVQTIPLSPSLVEVLREYMRYREGEPDEYLFCTDEGTMMTEACLRSSITRYNTSRGVKLTSIHAFRHTFARMYLVECGGNALKLQQLLGHSTLDMTKHYVRIYSSDLVADFQKNSPLEQLNKKSPQRMPNKLNTRRGK